MRVTTLGDSGSAPTSAAQVLDARAEHVARQRADLPPFRTVCASGRDAAVGAAHRMPEVLADVARSGRVEDPSAPGFDRIRPHLAQMIAARSRPGSTLPQITALRWVPSPARGE
jgi:rsbT co-antagonist protein RsbR